MLFFWTFMNYLLINPEKKFHSFQQNIKQHNCFHH